MDINSSERKNMLTLKKYKEVNGFGGSQNEDRVVRKGPLSTRSLTRKRGEQEGASVTGPLLEKQRYNVGKN